MQISRHWRLNAQRYRLEGFRNPNGELSLQPRWDLVNPEGSRIIKVTSIVEGNEPAITISGAERRAG